MSKGLGRVQREILRSLQAGGWVEAYGHRFIAGPHVYDLRAVSGKMAASHKADSHGRFVRGAFQTTFSRAIRGLLRRGQLHRVALVKVIESDRYRCQDNFHALADGLYFTVPRSRQTRFVSTERGLYR